MQDVGEEEEGRAEAGEPERDPRWKRGGNWCFVVGKTEAGKLGKKKAGRWSGARLRSTHKPLGGNGLW